MSGGELYISRFSAWAPGLGDIQTDSDWEEWAQDKREMPSTVDEGLGKQSPEIAFTDSMFRRRLSQISKMTIQVVHDLLPFKEDTKMIFMSFRGELSQQYKINKMQIEDGAVMPAAFSLSVFNTPPGLASIALGLKGGYSALYPAGNSFSAGLAAAKAELICGRSEELIFVYADEEIPPEYSSLLPDKPAPLAFGMLLSRSSASIPLSSIEKNSLDKGDNPVYFLKSLILGRQKYVSA